MRERERGVHGQDTDETQTFCPGRGHDGREDQYGHSKRCIWSQARPPRLVTSLWGVGEAEGCWRCPSCGWGRGARYAPLACSLSTFLTFYLHFFPSSYIPYPSIYVPFPLLTYESYPSTGTLTTLVKCFISIFITVIMPTFLLFY